MLALLVPLVWFCIGFFVLSKGADILVRGGASIARIFNMTPWFIGMVIFGIGTSIPELAIMIASVHEGNSVGLATIFGSTTFTVLGIIGALALVMPLQFRRTWVGRDLPIFLFSSLVTISIFALPPGSGVIARAEGVFLVLLLIAWIYAMLHRPEDDDTGIDPQVFTWTTSVVYIVAGCIGVYLGGTWVVDGATVLARIAGVSPELIGFTVLSLGTSLPEIAIACTAIKSRYIGLAMGTLIGSNIFDFFGIFGVAALIKPLPADEMLFADMFVTAGAILLLLVFVRLGRERFTIARLEGGIFIILYLMYVIFLMQRG